MKVNEVSPWEGKLIWVAEPKSGTSKNGNEWKSIEFVLEYKDWQGYDSKILFSAFGAEKVDKITSTPLGTTLKVQWRPESREYNGRWYNKFDAYDITVVSREAPVPTTKDEDLNF